VTILVIALSNKERLRQQTLLQAAKVFLQPSEYLPEIEEHERKSDSSEKQFTEAVLKFGGRGRRRTFATLPVSAGAKLLAAALDRFLVLGIFTNLALIKR